MSETIIAADLVAASLQELFGTYPTDPEGTATAVVLTVTDPATGAQHTVELQQGQASWLTRLVMDEVATNRNAHSDGNGQCGHCGGSGESGGLEDPAPYLGEDGLCYHGDGEVDFEASAELLSQLGTDEEDQDQTADEPDGWCAHHGETWMNADAEPWCHTCSPAREQ